MQGSLFWSGRICRNSKFEEVRLDFENEKGGVADLRRTFRVLLVLLALMSQSELEES
jgi:hypothetical protein